MSESLTTEYLSKRDTLLATVLDTIYDGVYIVDRQRRILFWSKGAEELTGFAADEVVGHCCGDGILNHIDADGRLLCKGDCPLLHIFASGESYEKKIYPQRKSGERFPTVTHAAPIRDDKGDIIAAIEVFRDVTREEEHRALQERMNRMMAQRLPTGTIEEIREELEAMTGNAPRLHDVSILYLGIVGFSAYAQAHPPIEAVELLNDVLGICETIAAEFYGDVEKTIGDGMMAVFIDPNDAVGAAERTLYALNVLNKARARERKEPVKVRIAVTTGRGIRGAMGSAKQSVSVLGEVVSTAAQLQQYANCDSICITEDTYARLQDPSRFTTSEEVTIEGKELPVCIYKYR
ncbi:MAG: PAS domain S-box protein [Candidatus Hydrogenedentes bacterium]|nr:PAS domain S-box protein [Candidatus Hydrogenedentota bacterium]